MNTGRPLTSVWLHNRSCPLVSLHSPFCTIRLKLVKTYDALSHAHYTVQAWKCLMLNKVSHQLFYVGLCSHLNYYIIFEKKNWQIKFCFESFSSKEKQRIIWFHRQNKTSLFFFFLNWKNKGGCSKWCYSAITFRKY